MADIMLIERPTISKGEHCLSCLLKSEAVELADGIAIICSLELKPEGVIDLEPSDSCPNWKLNPDADIAKPEINEDQEPNEPAASDDMELQQPYEFVNDSLVLVKDTTQPHTTMMLTTSFVEAYNAMVQLTKSRVQQKIDELNSDLKKLLLRASEQVENGVIDEAVSMIEEFNTFELDAPSGDNVIDAVLSEEDLEDIYPTDDNEEELEDEFEEDDFEEDDFSDLDELELDDDEE